MFFMIFCCPPWITIRVFIKDLLWYPSSPLFLIIYINIMGRVVEARNFKFKNCSLGSDAVFMNTGAFNQIAYDKGFNNKFEVRLLINNQAIRTLFQIWWWIRFLLARLRISTYLIFLILKIKTQLNIQIINWNFPNIHHFLSILLPILMLKVFLYHRTSSALRKLFFIHRFQCWFHIYN